VGSLKYTSTENPSGFADEGHPGLHAISLENVAGVRKITGKSVSVRVVSLFSQPHEQ
jgi:hypothetical protein